MTVVKPNVVLYDSRGQQWKRAPNFQDTDPGAAGWLMLRRVHDDIDMPYPEVLERFGYSRSKRYLLGKFLNDTELRVVEGTSITWGPRVVQPGSRGEAMSYSIWMSIDTGGPELAYVGEDWNYTSNCAPMWREAGANLADFHGKTAGECLPILEKAISELRANPEKYVAMNPENGWGSYELLVPYLERLASNFRNHPKATVEVSR